MDLRKEKPVFLRKVFEIAQNVDVSDTILRNKAVFKNFEITPHLSPPGSGASFRIWCSLKPNQTFLIFIFEMKELHDEKW